MARRLFVPLLNASLITVAACSGAGVPEGARTTPPRTSEQAQPSPAPAVPRTSRLLLGSPEPSSLPTTVEPVYGDRAAMLVSQAAGEREAFVRFVGTDGTLSPTLALRDELVSSAFRATDGRRGLVTVRGEATCIALLDGALGAVASRSCTRIDAKALAFTGDRFAFFSVARPEKPKASEPFAKPLPAPPKPKPKVEKKTTKKAGSGSKKSKTTKTAKKEQKREPVEVVLRWASLEGVFEPEQRTGLTFVPPMDGMSLIDAIGSPAGVQLAYYETEKPSPGTKRKKGPPSLGWAAIRAGTIGLDGAFVPKSTAKLAEGELDWGAVRGFFAPRWIVGRDGALATQEAQRGGYCGVSRASGSGSPQRAVCAIDPGASPDAAMLAAMERLLQKEPRRAPGQPKSDPGLVVWAGDRALFVTGDGTALGSAGRDGEAREEPPPFSARRGRMAWANVFPDGTGVALANGRVFVLDAAGELHEGQAKDELFPMARAHSGETGGIAKIGASMWVARGDIGRVFPSALAPEVWRGRGHPDGTALVGGEKRGISIELSGGRLRISGLDENGAVVAPALSDGRPRASDSPVRPGFLAVERAGGGAIVAGVAATNPTQVVSFFVDAEGRLGPARATSLGLREGELALRLSPLPQGGAILADGARTRAVWLDDDGRELAAATWPAGEADAVCRDGTPGRPFQPGVAPGAFVEVEALGAPGTCVISEPVWANDGSLRWFGTTNTGLDVLPEARIVRGLGAPVSRPAIAPPEKAEAVRASAPRPCPPEMVLVDGKLCVDRFEATIVDMASGEQLSPDYPVTPNLMQIALSDWATGRSRVGNLVARAMPLPFLPSWQRAEKLDLVAVPRRLARPNGYVTGLVAETACVNAGKRLCKLAEFVLACRGDHDTPFPYGDTYESGACNVNRDAHPAALLHDNASVGHLDPRLNRVRGGDGPLFRETGATLTCRSTWGNDAIYDMVGNLDEWVDEGAGAFAGGFYARSTRAGCDAVITAHPKNYLDYSTGVRCCKDASP